MLAGLVLLLTGVMFLAVGVLLPRLLRPIMEIFGALPMGLPMANSAVPGANLLRWLPLVNRSTQAALLAGVIAVGMGIYGFIARPTPFWLNLLAILSALMLVTVGGGLVVAARKFGPMMQQFSAMKNMFRM